jgi:hypothetical protein
VLLVDGVVLVPVVVGATVVVVVGATVLVVVSLAVDAVVDAVVVVGVEGAVLAVVVAVAISVAVDEGSCTSKYEIEAPVRAASPAVALVSSAAGPAAVSVPPASVPPAPTVVSAGVVCVVCVVVCGCAGAAAPSVAGSATGVPISSDTTSVSANGSFAFVLPVVGDGATCECTSLITGTRCTTRCLVAVRFVRCVTVVGAACEDARTCATGGRAGSAWTFGTPSSGMPSCGYAMFGSGTRVAVAGAAACRSAAAIGTAYIETRTSNPRPAHQ